MFHLVFKNLAVHLKILYIDYIWKINCFSPCVIYDLYIESIQQPRTNMGCDTNKNAL